MGQAVLMESPKTEAEATEDAEPTHTLCLSSQSYYKVAKLAKLSSRLSHKHLGTTAAWTHGPYLLLLVFASFICMSGLTNP